MTTQSGIHFSITKEDGSPTPCKAQIIGINGTVSQNLALLIGHMDAHDQFHSENGKFSIGLAPGNYKVIVTRGIEHDHFEKTIEIVKGQFGIISTLLSVRLKQQVG